MAIEVIEVEVPGPPGRDGTQVPRYAFADLPPASDRGAGFMAFAIDGNGGAGCNLISDGAEWRRLSEDGITSYGPFSGALTLSPILSTSTHKFSSVTGNVAITLSEDNAYVGCEFVINAPPVLNGATFMVNSYRLLDNQWIAFSYDGDRFVPIQNGILPVPVLSGYSDIALDPVVGSATGFLTLIGHSDLTLDPISGGATGVAPIHGTSGLTLDTFTGSATGLVSPNEVIKPAAMTAPPFNARIFKDPNTGIYSTNFDPTSQRLVEGASGVTTYYVDIVNGSDTNPGTSASPFKTLAKPLTVSRATAPSMLIKAKGGTYGISQNLLNAINPLDLSVVSWDGNPIFCTMELPLTGASWTLGNTNTYNASVSGAAFGSAKNASTVWDGKTLDAFGDYLPYKAATSQANCEATSGSYWVDTTNSRIYVHCSDNRAPDSNIHCFESWNSPGTFLNSAGSPANQRFYLENVHFRGGTVVAQVKQTDLTFRTKAIFNNCSFKYGGAGVGVLQIAGGVDIAFVNSLAALGYNDVFNYHSSGTALVNALEVGCEGRKAGVLMTGSAANQGTTIHDACTITRVNGYYHDNESDQVGDVVNSTKSWNLGCRAETGSTPGFAGWRCGNTTSDSPEMWLDGCSSTGNTFDINVTTLAKVHLRNFTGHATNTGAGVIDSY